MDSDLDQISAAAKMAGEWWAERLDPQHTDKRQTFAEAVAKHCESEMRAVPFPECWLEVDYDPQGPMLLAVRDVIDPDCKGWLCSADGILPYKHKLRVWPYLLVPKEGDNAWKDDIPVPDANPDSFDDRYARLLYDYDFVEQVSLFNQLHPTCAVQQAKSVVKRFKDYTWETKPLPPEYAGVSNVEHHVIPEGHHKSYCITKRLFDLQVDLDPAFGLDPAHAYDIWTFTDAEGQDGIHWEEKEAPHLEWTPELEAARVALIEAIREERHLLKIR